jgi:hypothetical protein
MKRSPSVWGPANPIMGDDERIPRRDSRRLAREPSDLLRHREGLGR